MLSVISHFCYLNKLVQQLCARSLLIFECSLIVESKEYANICNTIYCCNVSSMQSNKTVLYMFRITTSEVYRTIDALLQFLHVTH